MVKVQLHPSAPLAIANYTQTAQFTPEKWNHITDLCRGLIWNTETEEIVARPFPKFWNYNDQRHAETLPENLPTAEPLLTRKEDGSLAILFKNPVNGFYEAATRGSFVSEQAVWATKWVKHRQAWPDSWTPLAEIIYPENRIVIDYRGWSGLKLLALVDVHTGAELDRETIELLARHNDMEVVPLYNKLLNIAVEEDQENEEGYVATWPRPNQSPLRVKIKFGTYRKLHKILTGTSAIGIWELLRDGKSTAEIFEHTPEEFKSWVKKTELELVTKYHDIEHLAQQDFSMRPLCLERKQFAEYAKSTPHPHLLFSILDGKDLSPAIWKSLRPVGDVRPFKDEENS